MELRPSDEVGPAFRVEELSTRTGTPVRTIREYQTWKVLHPPARVGRVGLYDETHVERLEGIARLQGRGYSIAAIRDLFQAWEQGAELRQVLGVDETTAIPADEAPITLTAAQLARLLPAVAESERLLRRAGAIGLLRQHGATYGARSPALLQLTADVIAAGLSPTAALDLADAIIAAAQQAGEAAATTVAAGLAHGGSVEPLVRRGRVLLARAVASHTIDQVGRHLMDHAEAQPELAELLAEVRIGAVASDPGTAG